MVCVTKGLKMSEALQEHLIDQYNYAKDKGKAVVDHFGDE